MPQNQIKLMQELSGLGTYQTQHPEPLELFPQPHDSLFHKCNSAGLCYPVESGCYFWAAAAAVVVVDSVSVHYSSGFGGSARCAWGNCWHNVPLRHT